MALTDIVFALVGDVRQDSRSLRQLRALATGGYRIEVLTFGPPADASPLPKNVYLRVLQQPAGSGPLFFWRVHRLFRAAARKQPAAAYHASDLYVLPALHHAAQQHDGCLVYDARELYPHVGATAGKPWAQWFWHALERHYIRRADLTFTVNESISQRLAATYNVAPPLVIPNVPPHQNVPASEILREKTGIPPEQVLVLYQGAFKPGRGCERLIDAMVHVEGAALVLLGDGPLESALRERVRSLGLEERVRFHPRVPPDDLLSYTASADIGAVLTEARTESLYLSLPNKLFQYLMAELPVLVSDLPELRRLVEQYDVGCTANPDDPEEVAATLQAMVDDAAARKRWRRHTSTVFETYSWEKASQQMRNAYDDLLDAA